MFYPCLIIFYLNLFAFKFKLQVQNLFKFEINFYLNLFKYYLLTESEVITEKSQTEALMY